MLTVNTKVHLNNGLEMPLLGFGTWQAKNGDIAYNAVRAALDAGYRHLDTARIYGNEASVGKAIRDSGIPRDQIWVTTKLLLLYGADAEWMFQDSFKKLGLEYIDLLLVHFPTPFLVKHNWRKLEKIFSLGTVKSLGVSNHSIRQVRSVLSIAKIKPVLNQIRCSPYNYDPEMHKFLKEQHLFMEAYSPLTRGSKLQDERLVKMAEKYHKSPAQILIRWCLQKEIIVIPKSVHKERIRENAAVYDFEILEADMEELDGFGKR
jgi:diketogulonate reductase-like aldo/keto reductase